MAKTLVKLYDDEIDLEEFLLVEEEDIENIVELLEKYRESDEEYNIDGFFNILDENGIEYDHLPVENIYF